MRQLYQRKDWLITEFYEKNPSYWDDVNKKAAKPFFSRANLKKYWPKEFKYLRNKDGRCALCKRHAELARTLNRMIPDFTFPEWHPCMDVPNPADIDDEIPIALIPKFDKTLKEYLEYDEHVHAACRIRRFHRNRRKPYAWPTQVLGVSVDSKEPQILGKGPHMNQDRVFSFACAAIFGLVATYREKGEADVKNVYFDAISRNKDHTSYAQKSHIKNIFDDPKFAMLILKFTELELYCDNASHFISEEFAHFVCKEIGQIFPHLTRVSFFAFAPRHGKSDCDRHFQKVAMWCKEFERKQVLAGPVEIKKAIIIGRDKANATRREKNLPAIDVWPVFSNLVEPTEPKKTLCCPGIQSTMGITYVRSTDKVYNHVFPDITDYTNGVELNEVRSEPYQRVDQNGVEQPFLQPLYAPLKPLVYTPTTAHNQHVNREKLMKQMEVNRILARRQGDQLLPLNE